MDYQSKMMMRQVALVSYGTKFLRHEIALEDWYRHHVFFDARQQFRTIADNTLLAADFTLWLGALEESGATRLSLHLADEFDPPGLGAKQGCAVLLVVHYPALYEVWAVGEERASWAERSRQVVEIGEWFPRFPSAAAYGGAIDSYWCIVQIAGRLDVPATHWKSLAASVAADLDIPLPSHHATPFILPTPDTDSWAVRPLFPYSPASAPAHRLLAMLRRQQDKFSNDTASNNENSFYKNLSQEQADQMDQWGRLLDRWVVKVQLCCANECGNGIAVKSTVSLKPAAGPQDRPSKPPPPPSQWINRIGLTVSMAVVSLFIFAIANVIAWQPWVALLIGLPFVLVGRYKNPKD